MEGLRNVVALQMELILGLLREAEARRRIPALDRLERVVRRLLRRPPG